MSNLSEEALLKAIAELRAKKIKVGIRPATLTISPAAKAVADAYGVSVVQLFSDVIRYRQQRYRDYMRNYMRKRRNSQQRDR